jgi:hypothetical protein
MTVILYRFWVLLDWKHFMAVFMKRIENDFDASVKVIAMVVRQSSCYGSSGKQPRVSNDTESTKIYKHWAKRALTKRAPSI